MGKPIMLIVGDLEVNRVSLASSFVDEFMIVYAENGIEAQRYVEASEEQIKIILLDILMPAMDGIEFLKWISNSEYQEIPIIVITTEPAYQIAALENGAWDFISKPFAPDVIKARVHFVLKRLRLLREKKYVRELEKTKQQMNHLVNSIPGGIAIYRMTDKFETIYFSDGVARLTGHTRKEYAERIGNNAINIIYETDRIRMEEASVKMLNAGEPIDIFHRIYHKDGHLVWVRLNALPMEQTENGTIVYAVFQSLSKQIQLYQNILDESQSAIYVCDATNYELLYVNHRAELFAGLDTTLVNGRKCYEVLFNWDSPCTFCKMKTMTKDSFVEREFVFPVNQRTYMMKGKIMDWNNLTAHIEYIDDITEERKVQQQNAMLLEQLTSIMENVPGALCLYRFDGKRIEPVVHNKAFYEVMGYSEKNVDSVNQETTYRNVHPEDLPILQKKSIEAFRTNQPLKHTYRLFHDKRNGYIWLRLNGIVVPQADGTKMAYCTYTDVTEEKEAEQIAIEAKDKAEQLYQQQLLLMENENDDGLIGKGYLNLTRDKSISIQYTSENAVILPENVRFDEVGRILASHVLDPAQRQAMLQMVNRKNQIQNYKNGITDSTLEYQRRNENGTVIWVSFTCKTVVEPSTNELYCFYSTYDITERIQQDNIVNHITEKQFDFIAVADVSSRTVTVRNIKRSQYGEVAYKTQDYDSECMMAIMQCVVWEDREKVRRKMAFERVLEELDRTGDYFFTYSVVKSDRKPCWKKLQYCYLDTSRCTVLVTLEDITQVYYQEQEQLRKIAVALQEAKAANHAKTEFFSRMSHDMRTPMNGILGVASLSENENDPVILKQNMEKIKESGKYLLGLINDTLDFHRIESGKFMLEPQVFRGAEVVENILEIVKQTADENGIRLLVNNGNVDLNWYVRADAMRIKQIFINLLSNAVKFTKKGGVVEFSIQLLSREGMISHDLISIKDTGIGMSKEFLRDGIFKPFSQEYNDATSQYVGTGLGLSIVKSLVEMMGGRIEVQSALGKGTKFDVYLDFERVDSENVKMLSNEDEKYKESMKDRLEGRHILLIEDHPLNAEIAMKMLKRVGCHVTWMRNGAEGVRCFQRERDNPFDAILMDIRMPVLNGLEATQAIRGLSKSDAETIPIIAMTANAYQEDIQQSLAAGMNGHMEKPIEPDKLYQILSQYMGRRKG